MMHGPIHIKSEGVLLLGYLREKRKAYLGSFSLDSEDIKSWVWNFNKEQGSSPELIIDYGAKGPVM